MFASNAAVDSIVAQSRRALTLPDSTFRTEYDINNVMAANIERLQAAVALAPTRAAEIDEICASWRSRFDTWKANQFAARSALAGPGALASAADFQIAMAEQDAEASAQDGDAKPAPRRRRAKDRKDKHANDDEGGGAGQRHGGEPAGMERGASLEFYLQGAAAPNPRQHGSNGSSPALTPRTAAKAVDDEDVAARGHAVHSETLKEPPVIVGTFCIPADVVSSSASIRLVNNSANAIVVFDAMASGHSAMSEPSPSTHKRRSGTTSPSKRSPGNSRPGTPKAEAMPAPPPEVLERCNIDVRVTTLRSVLRSIIHLSTQHLQGITAPSDQTDDGVAVIDLDTVRAVLPTITVGTESKLPKALRAPKKQAAVKDATHDDDEEEDEPPMGGARAGTVEYRPAQDDAEEDGAEIIDAGDADVAELSSRLVAEFERQAAEERQAELLAGDGTVGRTGLPTTVPARTLAVSLPKLRDAPMAILMCHGGCFAGGVFIAGTAILHKTFERYVVRKKQGGKQSAQGAGTNSAGSQIRKMQETKWREDVKHILDEWRPLLDSCWVIAYVAPGPDNKKILTDFTVDWQPRVGAALPPPIPEMGKFFERSRSVFKPSNAMASPVDILNDPRVISAPLTTHKPTFAEVERIYAALRSLTVQRVYRMPKD